MGAVDDGSKMKGQAIISVTLTDMQVGDKVLPVKTKAVSAAGGKGTGTKKVLAAPQSVRRWERVREGSPPPPARSRQP